MVIVIADKDGKALRELSDYTLEVAYGEDENTITITADADVMPPNGGYAYIDGTEYGGTIDKIKSGTANNTLSGSGRSWHGVLAGKRIVPASGQSHVVVSGQVATVLQQIIDMIGLSELFEAPSAESDQVTISNYQFERFVDAYTGLKALCLAYGLKLTMRFASNKVSLGAKAVVDYGSKVDSDLLDFDITVTSRCTNHLICGGTGENENRAIIHFYADAEGNVSHTQTFFGIDEIVGFYDYSNASEEQLEENGKKKLEELQTEGEVQVSVHDDLDIDVGDIVTGRDNRTGMIVSAPITKKMSDKFSTVMTMDKTIALDANSYVESIKDIGDEVNVGDELIVFDQAHEDSDVAKYLEDLRKRLGDELHDMIMINSMSTIKTKYAGKITDIKVYSTVPVEELSESLQKIVKKYTKKSDDINKLLEKYRNPGDMNYYKCGQVITETSDPLEPDYQGRIRNHKIGNDGKGVLIIFYIYRNSIDNSKFI